MNRGSVAIKVNIPTYIFAKDSDTDGKNEYIVALLHTKSFFDSIYSDYQIIRADNGHEAEQKYNKINDCSNCSDCCGKVVEKYCEES